jgi:glycosyltransferase involved in cell wall biosynthesis
MPKILMMTTDQMIDRRILLESDALAEDGWEVMILATAGARPDHSRVVTTAAHRERVLPTPNKATALFSVYRLLRRRVSMNGALARRLKSLVWRRLMSPDEFARRLMLPSALDYRSDVVVAHDLPILPAAAEAAKHHGAKLVYDSHELYCEQEFEPPLQRMWRAIERRSIGACDCVITVNPSIAGELKTRYALPRVDVVANAERTEGPPPVKGGLFHQAFGLNASAVIVLFQGGLLAGRNLEMLVDAMARVNAPQVHLVFLGDGALARPLSRRATARGVAARVHFHGAVAQSDLLHYTASADLGVIPYQATCLNNLYCTPNKLFEYIAAAVPMLATDLPEMRRLIAGNDIGLMIDTGSPDALARAVDHVVSDTALLARFRANLKDVRARVNWAEESKTLVEIFRRLKPAPGSQPSAHSSSTSSASSR